MGMARFGERLLIRRIAGLFGVCLSVCVGGGAPRSGERLVDREDRGPRPLKVESTIRGPLLCRGGERLVDSSGAA